LQPSDKVVGIGFYFMFSGGRPTISGYLSALVMTGENAAQIAQRADEYVKIRDEMKQLEPYVHVTDKRPDMGKLKQYAALAQKLGSGLAPYIEGTGTTHTQSSGHSIDDWMAGGGQLVTQEVAAVMDRLIGDLAKALFK